MKRLILIVTIVFSTLSYVSEISAHPQEPTARQREQWFTEMRRYKADFIAKELELTEDQKEKFVPLYEEMDERMAKVGEEARKMEKSVNKKGEKATNEDYEKAAELLYNSKSREAAIEMEYYDKFKLILTKKQLFNLKGAERKFTRQLMDNHPPKGKKH